MWKMRVPLIAGNWKMHKNHLEAVELVRGLHARVADLEGVEIAVCPPFTAIPDVSRLLGELASSLVLGAQDVYPADEGAFTGEISPGMLKALDVVYVIPGHSERREILGEDDAFVARKVKAVPAAGWRPSVGGGARPGARAGGTARAMGEGQLEAALGELSAREMESTVIAYEPIWAIGTGKTATPGDAQEMNAFIRSWLEGRFGGEVSGGVRILYGGSVKPDNAAELMAMPDVDGALVGGASLKAEDFAAIARSSA
jgi:triosephosphate isomerase